MNYSFERDFQQIGLSEKESKVYIASLILGPSPVQIIAAKAGVNRATTYVMIESLIERGLMGSVKRGKKTFFLAERPDHISHLIDEEKKQIQKKKELLDALLPKLSLIIDATDERPKIEMFEGLKGLREIHEDLVKHGKSIGSIDNIAAVDDARELVLYDEIENHWEQLASHKIKVRAIITKTGPEKVPEKYKSMWEERIVPKDNFPFHGEIVIYGNRIAGLAYKGKIIGVIIDSHEIAQTLRALFQLAWDGAAKYQK